MSWRHEPGGFELFFNRDETKARGPELAPALFTQDGVRALAPTDTDFGGTWVTVNEHGLAAGILNGYRARSPRTDPVRSRGRLVRALAGRRSISAALAWLDQHDLEAYAPFELILLEPDAPAATLEWDGAYHVQVLDADDRVPLVSSGVAQAEARRQRRADFARFLSSEGLTSRALAAFHASHASRGGAREDPSAYSTCMHRADAETRSRTRVRVRSDEVAMIHTPGPPCRTTESPPITLARRAPAPGRPA